MYVYIVIVLKFLQETE